MKRLAIDIGNVICDVNFGPFIAELSKALNVSTSDVDYFLNRTQKLHDLGLTHMSDELRDHFKIKSQPVVDILMAKWRETIRPNDVVIAAIKDLLNNNVRVALLSNMGFEHSELMRSALTSDIYDNCIRFFSCHVGARKPTMLYYKMFLDMHPDFGQCVYLDDRIENIAAGRDFGFDAIHFALDSFGLQDGLKSRLDEIKARIE